MRLIRLAERFPLALVAAAFFSFAASASARCVLPVADGGSGEATPSRPNVQGHVVAVNRRVVTVRTVQGGLVQVRLAASDNPVITAFGGDGPASVLRAGQSAKVWFVGCTAPRQGMAQAAYFEIYSGDVADKPPADYFQ